MIDFLRWLITRWSGPGYSGAKTGGRLGRAAQLEAVRQPALGTQNT
jgi:hypothetical protein